MLRVSLLGELALTDQAGVAAARSARTIALVGFLALHAGAPQSRHRIAGLFWPESGEAQALTNLRRELHQLRQVLSGEPSLVVTSRALCWQDTVSCRVDLRVFDREGKGATAAAAAGDSGGVVAHATRAIAEYQGDFLPGVPDDWTLDAREELERQCVGLCDLLGQARAQAGDLTGAVEVARRRIQLRPLEENGYQALMRLQADAGDRAGAVSTYHHCASVLERELGVGPDPATYRVLQRVMTSSRPTRGAAPPAGRQAGRSGAATSRLFGRADELARLTDVWAATAAGRSGLVLVRGGAGVGKTRLLAEVAALARRQGAVVASSRCFGTSGRLALAPVADWLRHEAVQAAVRTLAPAWRTEVGRLLPPDGAGDAGKSGNGPRAMADAWQRHRFFEGLARALMAVGRPTLLILDNIHWCDLETLAFITFCLGLAPGCPVLVAATWRDEQADDPELADWTVRMRATGVLTELTLTPLDEADTARLARATAGTALNQADADLLCATTGGFPLFVIEAVRTTSGPGGTPLAAGDLREVLHQRFRQVSAPAREVAGLAAAVGTNFTLGLLSEASDLDADTVVAAVDELWRRRILREFRDGYDFAHDMLRETAYEEVSPPRRWLLHRRVAQSLELLHAYDADAVAAHIADQYARGGQDQRAVDYYRRAADVAAARFGYGEAIRLHRQALSVIAGLPPGRGRDFRELAILDALAAPLNARYGYSSVDLERTLERATALAESLGRKDSMVAAMIGQWTTLFVQGRTADCYRLAARALDLVDAGSELAGAGHFAVGGSALSLGRLAEGLRHLELAAARPGPAVLLSVGTRSDVHSTAFAAHAHWLLGHDGDARAASSRAIALAREIGDPYNLAVALAYAGITHQMRDDRPELSRAVAELRDLCARYEFAYYREWVLILSAWSGDAGEDGLSLARQGIANLKSQRAFARMPYWLSLLADLLERAGRPDAARATLDAALAAAGAHDDVWWLPEVMRMRAAHDKDHAAVTRLQDAVRLAAGQGSAELARRCRDDLDRRTARTLRERTRP